MISNATGKEKSSNDIRLLTELVDSGIVICCNNVTDPNFALAASRDLETFKLYMCDTGLFITLMGIIIPEYFSNINEIYTKLLCDKLPINLGYLYENIAAQTINTKGYDVFYHTWRETRKTHSYEIDFLLPYKNKVMPIEVKSSGFRSITSMNKFCEKFSSRYINPTIFSQKDYGHSEEVLNMPICYLEPFLDKL